MNRLFTELRRRNVFRVAGVYAVVGWLLAQAATTLEGAVGLPVVFPPQCKPVGSDDFACE